MKRTLLVIVGSLARGGTETHLLTVLPRLLSRGYDVEVFLLSRRGALAEDMERGGVGLIAPWWPSEDGKSPLVVRSLRMVVVAVQLLVHLIFKRPRIVHFFLPASYLIGAPLAIISGIRTRIMSRRSLNHYQNKHSFSEGLERRLHQWMHALLGNSRAVVKELVEQEHAPPERVGLIYNGIATEGFDAPPDDDFRDAFGITHDTLVITVVANLIPYKGHLDLLEGLAQISDRLGENWLLVLAGRDDGHGGALRACCVAKGFEDKVKFLGQFRDVKSLLAGSDIFVLPSHEEGFSNALLEAMAAGVGIVATDVGGNGEAVVDGESGLIVPSQDAKRLGEAVATLAADRELRQRLAVNAARRVRSEFTVARCVDEYDRLYQTLLGQGALADLKTFNWAEKPQSGGAGRLG